MYDKRTASGGPTSLFLSFSTPAGEHPSFKSAEHDCALWSRALERSFLSSLRSTKRYSILSLSHVRDVALAAGGPGGGRAPQQTAHADWPRRAPKVTELVMAAARAGDRTNLVSLLQSGLPFPKSPSQQDLAREASEELNIATQRVNGISAVSPSSPGAGNSSSSGSATANSRIAVVGDSVLDEVEEEREERRWWALRLSEVRQELSAEKEIDSMVESLRSENYNKNQTVNPMEVSPRLGGAPHARRRVRQGLPVLRNVAHQPSGASNGQASAAGKENVSPATTSGGLFRGVGSKRR